MKTYNDPFYFALPHGASQGDLSVATAHIRDTFGVEGKCEVVRHELAFTLCRLRDTTERPVTR